MSSKRVRADFNGLFGDVLCLSHQDFCVDEDGNTIHLHAGMSLSVFDEDLDDAGLRDDIIASGIVEKSPDWLQCQGSKWALKIDGRGVRHVSALKLKNL